MEERGHMSVDSMAFTALKENEGPLTCQEETS